MPFHFRSRREEAASRRARYALAFIVFVVAVAILIGWLVLSYYLSGIREETSESSAPLPVETEVAETAASLLIINGDGQDRFVLIQFKPKTHRAYTLPLPSDTAVDNGLTLSKTLQKHGARQAKEQAAALLDLPITHYITLTPEDVAEYIAYLEGGVTYTLPEKATYKNDSMVEATLLPGKHQLTARQVSELFVYSGWSEPHTVAAELTAAVLNQYMIPDHSFSGDYATLANLMQTDIRIDRFNAYHTTLKELADSNTDGTFCTPVPITGKREKGRYYPNLDALQKTALYDE